MVVSVKCRQLQGALPLTPFPGPHWRQSPRPPLWPSTLIGSRFVRAPNLQISCAPLGIQYGPLNTPIQTAVWPPAELSWVQLLSAQAHETIVELRVSPVLEGLQWGMAINNWKNTTNVLYINRANERVYIGLWLGLPGKNACLFQDWENCR